MRMGRPLFSLVVANEYSTVVIDKFNFLLWSEVKKITIHGTILIQQQ